MPTGRLAVSEKPFGLAPFLRFFNRCGMLASLDPPQAAVGLHSQRAPFVGLILEPHLKSFSYKDTKTAHPMDGLFFCMSKAHEIVRSGR